ncbi:hypothetical protein D3C85_1394410 [compost metagenome]
MPILVATSATPIGPATVSRLAGPAALMPFKADIIPQTVPNKPIKGDVLPMLPMLARMARPLSSEHRNYPLRVVIFGRGASSNWVGSSERYSTRQNCSPSCPVR